MAKSAAKKEELQAPMFKRILATISILAILTTSQISMIWAADCDVPEVPAEVPETVSEPQAADVPEAASEPETSVEAPEVASESEVPEEVTETAEEAQAEAPEAAAPAAFDFRAADLDGTEQNYVTPVRNQGSTGTCWVFAPIAAAEISAMTAGVEDPDFSELYVVLLANDADASEGMVLYRAKADGSLELVDPFLSMGDNGEYIASRMMSWKALVDESYYDVNYPLNGRTSAQKADSDETALNYPVRIQNVSFLPSPADRSGNLWTGYNEEGTAAIKDALTQGQAVTICFNASTGMAGGSGSTADLNYRPKAQYTDDASILSSAGVQAHMGVIVGWDDSYSAENFNVRPAGDGAWIIKNSWGTLENWRGTIRRYLNTASGRASILEAYRIANGLDEETAAQVSDEELILFAMPVDRDGYFYISYYDKSIYNPIVYEAELNDYDTIYQYDDLNLLSVTTPAQSDPCGTIANVFTAVSDQLVKAVSTYTAEPGSTVELSLYELREGVSNPTDGTLLATASEVIRWSGYHTVKLETPVSMTAGTVFSVVAHITSAEGEGYTPIELGYNVRYINQDGETTRRKEYRVAENPAGASYLLTSDGWVDLAGDIIFYITEDGWLRLEASAGTGTGGGNAHVRVTPSTTRTVGSPLLKVYATLTGSDEPQEPGDSTGPSAGNQDEIAREGSVALNDQTGLPEAQERFVSPETGDRAAEGLIGWLAMMLGSVWLLVRMRRAKS